MIPEPCPVCKGYCCRADSGLHLPHRESHYTRHWCDDCKDGTRAPRLLTPALTAKEERAAIVAYLRYQAEVFVDDERALCRAADDIEQGAQHTTGRLR